MYLGKDIAGLVFGRLTVVSESMDHKKYGRRYWNCVCECGIYKVVSGASLMRGSSTSCGSCAHKTHGMSKTPTYVSWKSMIERCTSPRSRDYPRYGAVGVSVAPEWRKFDRFLADMGVRPDGTTLDRMDGSKGYEPGNCRWASPEEQGFNRKTTIAIEFNGVTDSVSGWARRLGIHRNSMAKRLKKWPLDKALSSSK